MLLKLGALQVTQGKPYMSTTDGVFERFPVTIAFTRKLDEQELTKLAIYALMVENGIDMQDTYLPAHYMELVDEQPTVCEPHAHQLTLDDVEDEDYIPTVIFVKPLDSSVGDGITAGVWCFDHYEMDNGDVWGFCDLHMFVKKNLAIVWACYMPEPPEVSE